MADAVIRAKMRVESVTHHKDNDGATEQEDVTLRAVYGPAGTENGKWSKWTPNGLLQLSITNPGAQDKVRRGHVYFVDLTPVTETPDN